MAVKNSLARNTKATAQAAPQNKIARFMAGGMEISLTPEIVRNYLVSGNKEQVTMQEVSMFINLCKYSGLNPWLKEAYCIKYGSEPATMVIGKEAFMKRAESHPQFDGFEAGIIVETEDGEINYRQGTVLASGEKILGGWAEVWRKDRGHSTRAEVSMDEYAGRKKDGSMNGQWSKKPATMIRKVALVQALREAFPAALGGLYTAEEQGAAEPEVTLTHNVDIDTGEIVEAEVVKEPEPAPAQEEPADDDLLGGF